MPVPTLYRTRTSNIQPTIEYLDFAGQVGYKRYYAQLSSLSGATSYKLSPNSIGNPSSFRFTSGALPLARDLNTGGSFGDIDSLNFDLEFQAPIILKGDAIFNGTMGLQRLGNNTTSGGFVISYYKVNEASSAVLIASSNGRINGVAANDLISFRELIVTSIPTTPFIIGDILRARVQLRGEYFGPNTSPNYRIFHDTEAEITPANDRDGVAPSTQMTFDIPIQVDL